MIDRSQAMGILIDACPTFHPAWERYASAKEFDASLLYIHLGMYVRHLVRLFQTGETSEFPAVFRVVEALHRGGDPYVREAATIGFLETLQNIAGQQDLDPAIFVPFLGSESARWWEKLNRFWSGDAVSVAGVSGSGWAGG